MTTPFVEIEDGHRLFVRDWGAGKPVLLLSGWAMDSRIWAETMVALNAKGLRTIAYDRRGHGRSTDPGTADYDSLAADLAAVLDRLDLTDVTLVCHSGAAGEAIRYLAQFGSGRLSRLVLVGAMGPLLVASEENPSGVPAEMLDMLMIQMGSDLAGWIDANTDAFAPGTNPRVNEWLGSMILDCSRRIAIDFQHAIMHADFRAEAAALRLPVTIVHGDRDASAPIDLTARRYAELIPRSRLVVYEGAAHGLMFTHAERLATDIERDMR